MEWKPVENWKTTILWRPPHFDQFSTHESTHVSAIFSRIAERGPKET
jgi:hypothetical protein